MKKYQNYTEFWDLHDPTGPPKLYDQAKEDFTLALTIFLEKHDVLFYTGHAIARALWERMIDRRLHYHTPIHILSIFQFAEKEGITLEPWEELAIWFHDSVYIPQLPGTSEELSAMFMRAMVAPAFSETELAEVQFAIETTANHLHPYTNPLYNKILDLDMISFSWLDQVNTINSCIRKEFDYVNEETYNKGRKAFLTKLISKGFIYRSNEFKKYESLAVENINKQLETL